MGSIKFFYFAGLTENIRVNNLLIINFYIWVLSRCKGEMHLHNILFGFAKAKLKLCNQALNHRYLPINKVALMFCCNRIGRSGCQ